MYGYIRWIAANYIVQCANCLAKWLRKTLYYCTEWVIFRFIRTAAAAVQLKSNADQMAEGDLWMMFISFGGRLDEILQWMDLVPAGMDCSLCLLETTIRFCFGFCLISSLVSFSGEEHWLIFHRKSSIHKFTAIHKKSNKNARNKVANKETSPTCSPPSKYCYDLTCKSLRIFVLLKRP